MTMIAALLASDGIVLVSDGRVNDLSKKIINNKQTKVFEFSKQCAVLVAGGISNNLPLIMSGLQAKFKISNTPNLNDVVIGFYNFWTNKITLKNKNNTPLFILAGYNVTSPRNYELKIYCMSFDTDKNSWELFETKGKNTFFAHGTNKKFYDQFFLKAYKKGTDTLYYRNLLALECLQLAEKENPESVGGQATLWNIVPEKPILKISQLAIDKLKISEHARTL